MIKSVIFDLGRVLLTFEPMKYLNKLYGNTEKAEKLYNAVFGSKIWLDLDRGIISDEDAIMEMTCEYSDYADEIRFLIRNWVEMMEPVEESVKILEELKLKGYNLFLLSNFHRTAFEKVSGEYSFFRLFDGMLISSHYGLLKPEREIYLKMLQKFSLNPRECLFIDDTPVNIISAKELGIEGIVFTDPQSLKQELTKLSIL